VQLRAERRPPHACGFRHLHRPDTQPTGAGQRGKRYFVVNHAIILVGRAPMASLHRASRQVDYWALRKVVPIVARSSAVLKPARRRQKARAKAPRYVRRSSPLHEMIDTDNAPYARGGLTHSGRAGHPQPAHPISADRSRHRGHRAQTGVHREGLGRLVSKSSDAPAR
jgi:hypothetical protein